MTDTITPSAQAKAATARRLRQRRASERRFRLYGQMAIGIAITFLAILIISIGMKASSAFSRNILIMDLTVTDEMLETENQGDIVTDLNVLVRKQLMDWFPETADTRQGRRELYELTTRLAVLPFAEKMTDNPGLSGRAQTARIPLSDDLDLYLKGGVTQRYNLNIKSSAAMTLGENSSYRLPIDQLAKLDTAASSETLVDYDGSWFQVLKSTETALELQHLAGPIPALGDQRIDKISTLTLVTPSSDRRISNRQIAWIEMLKSRGQIETRFNASLFASADSTYPELAGAAAAIAGSLLTMFVTALFAIPVGILAAVYLEEFAPKNRMTNIIELNINNLAAVPSIIFGLLGAALFINAFGMPRSVPLVGGLVLGLLVLPTVIIASRAALKSVPPSVRTAALGLGASQTQSVFHHVLPLAAPGIMTGAILAMARALGETAPLLLIGMVAFVNEVPTGPTQEATTLPVLIYKWFSGAERAWEPMTSAVIIILLATLVLMNLAVVLLRRRFERRW